MQLGLFVILLTLDQIHATDYSPWGPAYKEEPWKPKVGDMVELIGNTTFEGVSKPNHTHYGVEAGEKGTIMEYWTGTMPKYWPYNGEEREAFLVDFDKHGYRSIAIKTGTFASVLKQVKKVKGGSDACRRMQAIMDAGGRVFVINDFELQRFRTSFSYRGSLIRVLEPEPGTIRRGSVGQIKAIGRERPDGSRGSVLTDQMWRGYYIEFGTPGYSVKYVLPDGPSNVIFNFRTAKATESGWTDLKLHNFDA